MNPSHCLLFNTSRENIEIEQGVTTRIYKCRVNSERRNGTRNAKLRSSLAFGTHDIFATLGKGGLLLQLASGHLDDQYLTWS